MFDILITYYRKLTFSYQSMTYVLLKKFSTYFETHIYIKNEAIKDSIIRDSRILSKQERDYYKPTRVGHFLK